MTDHLHTIFSSSGCPSEADLQLYLQGQLPDEEIHRIEAHLADCEMCSDELEGMALLKNPDQLPEIVKELESRMAGKQIRILRMKPRLLLTAAAVIVMLITTIFIFRFIVPLQQKPLLSEQNDTNVPGVTEIPALVEEKARVVTEVDRNPWVEKQNKPETRNKMTVNEIEIKKDPNVEEPLQDIALEQEEIQVPDISGKGEPEPQISLDKMSGVRQVQPAKTKEIAEDSVTLASLLINEKKSRQYGAIGGVSSFQMGLNFMEMAMEQFDVQNFPEAARLFQEVIGQDSDNYKAMYHLALCYIEMDRQKKALRVLVRLMEDPDSTYYLKAIDLTIKINANEPE